MDPSSCFGRRYNADQERALSVCVCGVVCVCVCVCVGVCALLKLNGDFKSTDNSLAVIRRFWKNGNTFFFAYMQFWCVLLVYNKRELQLHTWAHTHTHS